MDYTTDDIPAGLKIVEHPPGQFAWVIEAPPAGPGNGAEPAVQGRDGYASYEEAMKAGRAALGLPTQK